MLYTIGTSNRSIAEFSSELLKRSVTSIIDVRSSPYSKYAHFNAGQIDQWSPSAGFMYRQAGAALGGRSQVPRDHAQYLYSLDLLVLASEQQNVAIFCAEGDPENCHRSYEVAASLLVRRGISPINIRRDGTEQTTLKSLAITPIDRVPACIREGVLELLARDGSPTTAQLPF